jgi:NAD(P)-dependent dehydrogenase (short-subunit alcohol dehydrogenase family)
MQALVVGGSGMLAGVCRGLAAEGHDVSVVARGAERLEALRSERITPVQVDYTELAALEAALQSAVAERGPIGLAVCWIRSREPDSLRLVADVLPDETPLYHVLGTTGTPSPELADVDYRVVRLGRRGDRWLTNEEISAGMLEAIARGSADFLVGER